MQARHRCNCQAAAAAADALTRDATDVPVCISVGPEGAVDQSLADGVIAVRDPRRLTESCAPARADRRG